MTPELLNRLLSVAVDVRTMLWEIGAIELDETHMEVREKLCQVLDDIAEDTRPMRARP